MSASARKSTRVPRRTGEANPPGTFSKAKWVWLIGRQRVPPGDRQPARRGQPGEQPQQPVGGSVATQSGPNLTGIHARHGHPSHGERSTESLSDCSNQKIVVIGGESKDSA